MLFPHSWMKDLIEILIHRRCNSHSSKSSTPEKIVNVLLEMAKMYHSYRVNNILIVSNICKRNVFQTIKSNALNHYSSKFAKKTDMCKSIMEILKHKTYGRTIYIFKNLENLNCFEFYILLNSFCGLYFYTNVL